MPDAPAPTAPLCPLCQQGKGVPRAVRTAHDHPSVLVTYRCDACPHEWESPRRNHTPEPKDR